MTTKCETIVINATHGREGRVRNKLKLVSFGLVVRGARGKFAYSAAWTVDLHPISPGVGSVQVKIYLYIALTPGNCHIPEKREKMKPSPSRHSGIILLSTL